MKADTLPFGPGGLTFIAVYLLSLLLIGWFAYRARTEDSMRDFYLAGKGFGFMILVLTLYATQYSGNTLFGFTGKTYRIGYAWIMSIHFMTAIIVFYLLYAPQLHALARRKQYITPTDYLADRYGSSGINLVATLVMVVALSNFLLAQLKAMGHAMEGLTTLPPADAFLYGVIALALIIVVYETLGGLRAVAWTDAIQGFVLLFGFAVLIVMVFIKYGMPAAVTESIIETGGDGLKKLAVPDAQRCREWLSYVLLVGIGGALYPQAIQRIYAADSSRTLRRSFAVMAFLPLTTALIAVLVGITAFSAYPGLEGTSSDRALAMILNGLREGSVFGYWLVVVLFAAILAAVMSTADSALLSISSMLSKDMYGRFVNPGATDAQLTRLGKRLSWILIVVLAGLAIALREKATLIKLLDRKFDLLIQLAPAFMVGIHWRRLHRGPVLTGMLAGIVLALVLAYRGYIADVIPALEWMDGPAKIAGIHPGLFGLALNLMIVWIGSMRGRDGHRIDES